MNTTALGLRSRKSGRVACSPERWWDWNPFSSAPTENEQCCRWCRLWASQPLWTWRPQVCGLIIFAIWIIFLACGETDTHAVTILLETHEGHCLASTLLVPDSLETLRTRCWFRANIKAALWWLLWPNVYAVWTSGPRSLQKDNRYSSVCL